MLARKNGITFIGPRLGNDARFWVDKASARRVAMEAGWPVVAATDVYGRTEHRARAENRLQKIGYPLICSSILGVVDAGCVPVTTARRLKKKF